MYKEMGVRKVALEPLKMGLQVALDEEFMFPTDVEFYHHEVMRRTIMEIRAEVYGNKLKNIKYPANWKEAFKERWFPKWLLEKYPVKYKVYDAWALYPDLKLPRDTYKPVIHFMEMPKWSERD
jgi:hypothetical protein